VVMITLGEGCAVPPEVRVSGTSSLLIPSNVARSCGSQAGVSGADIAVRWFTLTSMLLVVANVVAEKELGGVAAAGRSRRRGWIGGDFEVSLFLGERESSSLESSERWPIAYWKSRR
jgi:hypothetical protein